jgi:hypothetical protein
MKGLKSCFYIPLAKGDIRRSAWTVESIRRNCSDYRIYLLLDGEPADFPPPEICGADVEVVYASEPSRGDWGRIWQIQNEGLAKALDRVDLAADCVFIRIDADALIVRPGFVERAQALFQAWPRCGQIGQCYVNIAGQPIENKGWERYFHRISKPAGLAISYFRYVRAGHGPLKSAIVTVRLRKLLRLAFSNGYPAGKFCQGGCYVLRQEMVRRMREDGWLNESPFRWLPAAPRLGDEPRLAPHVYAVGYEIRDDTGSGGLFAICAEEPYIHPEELLERGHYVIHSTKYGVTLSEPRMTEEELVAFLLGKGGGRS